VKIFVRDLKIDMLIGIYPQEHTTPQEVVANIEGIVDQPQNWQNDAMDDWVSYEEFVKTVRDIAGRGHISLLETFARKIAETLLMDQRLLEVTVRLEKTAAIPGAKSVGVEYRQGR